MLVTFLEIALLIAISESNSIKFNANREQSKNRTGEGVTFYYIPSLKTYKARIKLEQSRENARECKRM